jgi:hypothetical protein
MPSQPYVILRRLDGACGQAVSKDVPPSMQPKLRHDALPRRDDRAAAVAA